MASPRTWLLSCALLAACGSGASRPTDDPGPRGPLLAATGVPVSIAVEKYGLPLAGASIAVTAVRDSAAVDAARPGTPARSALFFSGGTDEDGRCEAWITLPADVTSVDVVVQHPGSAGPFSDERLRDALGPFAPSARVTFAREALDAVQITLEDAR